MAIRSIDWSSSKIIFIQVFSHPRSLVILALVCAGRRHPASRTNHRPIFFSSPFLAIFWLIVFCHSTVSYRLNILNEICSWLSEIVVYLLFWLANILFSQFSLTVRVTLSQLILQAFRLGLAMRRLQLFFALLAFKSLTFHLYYSDWATDPSIRVCPWFSDWLDWLSSHYILENNFFTIFIPYGASDPWNWFVFVGVSFLRQTTSWRSNRLSKFQGKRPIYIFPWLARLLIIAYHRTIEFIIHDKGVFILRSMSALLARDVAGVVIGETGQQMAHVKHIIGNINWGNNDGHHVINFRLFVLATIFWVLILIFEFHGCDEPELSCDRKIAHCKQ